MGERKSRPKVLVIDDYIGHQQSFSNHLAKLGCEPWTVGDGVLARQLFGSGHLYDLVVASAYTQRMGGLELLRWMKTGERTRHIPVIVQGTDFTSKEMIRACEEEGATYLSKRAYHEFELVVQRLLSTVRR